MSHVEDSSDTDRQAAPLRSEGAPPASPSAAENPTRLPEPPELRANLPVPSVPLSKTGAQYRRYGLAYTIPTALIAPVLVLTLLGAWLDGRGGGLSSAYTIAGAVIGIVVGMLNMLRLAARLNEDK
jgi:hypothetical protein